MTWLLWKEYRVHRLIVYVTLFLMLLPHLVAAYATIRWGRDVHAFLGSTFYSFFLSQIALALIGGNAIAGERADRSAEFQVYLPLTRGKILAAKLLLALAIAALVWLTNPPILCALSRDVQGADFLRDHRELIALLVNTAITSLTFFCVAWFFSSILSSPTFSVAAGLITPLLVISGLVFWVYLFEIRIVDGAVIAWWYRGICLALALPSFAAGTLLYLRRVEP